MTSTPTIGVLALQGDVREHLHALERLGARAVGVRRPSELDACDALVLPGGESTTMFKLARTFELFEPIVARLRAGMPAFGTCAGMIMLADEVVDGIAGQETFGGLDITVRRNAFGRQVDSFEGAVDVKPFDSPLHGVFIRAPWVEAAGDGVDVLATVPVAADAPGEGDTRIVAVQQGSIVATAFHPEVGSDDRMHRYFVDLVTTS